MVNLTRYSSLSLCGKFSCRLSAAGPQNFFRISKLSLLHCLLWQKSFWCCIFPSDVVPFQSKGVWALVLAHGRQYRRMGLVYFVTSSQCSIHARTSTKTEIAFFLHIIPNSRIVFGCNNKSDSENGRALHKIPFFNDHRPSEWKEEKMDRFCNLSLFMLACLWWRHKVN